MKTTIKFTVLIGAIAIGSCIRQNKTENYAREYEHSKKEFYETNQIKSIHSWNGSLNEEIFTDEALIDFSESGDTLHQRININTLGVVVQHDNHQIDYRFFKSWMPNMVNERLLYIKNKGLSLEESVYLQILNHHDSLGFKYVGMDIQSYQLSLFDSDKAELKDPEFTFYSNGNTPLYIPKEVLFKNQIVQVEYQRAPTSLNDTSISIMQFTSTFRLFEKYELQKILNLDKIFNSY